jgi:hypothetical protein
LDAKLKEEIYNITDGEKKKMKKGGRPIGQNAWLQNTGMQA